MVVAHKERIPALLVEKVHSETIVLIIDTHQAEHRRPDINLRSRSVHGLRCKSRAEHKDRNAVIGINHLVGAGEVSTVICDEDKDRVLAPLFLLRRFYELPDRIVRVGDNLILRLISAVLICFRHDERTMITDSQERSKERLAACCVFVQTTQSVPEQVAIRDAEVIDRGVRLIVVVRIDTIDMVIPPEGVHVIVLGIAGDEAEVRVPVLMQIVRQTGIEIRVYPHDRFGKVRHEAVMDSYDTVVSMDSCGVTVRPVEALLPKGAQIRREVLTVLLSLEVQRRH